MPRNCVMIRLLLTNYCAVKPHFYTDDRPRCIAKPWLVKPPRPVKR